MATPEQRRRNRRTAVVLVSLVLAFFVGIIVRRAVLGW